MGRHSVDHPASSLPTTPPAATRHAPAPPTGPTPLAATPPAAVRAPAPAAATRHRGGPLTGEHPLAVAGDGPATTVLPRPALAPPARRHRAAADAGRGRRASVRAAGAVALVGAIAGAGVATASTAAGPAPAPATGGLARPDVVDESVSVAARRVPVAPRTTATAPAAAPAAPSTTTPAAPAGPVAPVVRVAAPDDGGETLWSADFASAGLGNFKSTPWNMQGAPTPKIAGGALSVSMPGGGKRAEVEPDFKNLREGDEYYVGFSVRLADDFPVDTSNWQVITQFKNQGTGSPPLEVKVADGKFLVDGDSGGFSQPIGDARPGQWTHLVLKVRFSSSTGSVSAWQDGTQTLADYAPPSGTLYAGKSSYLKIGIYRSPAISQAGTLSFGSYAIGTSRGAVSKDLPTD